jgi:hypothetical protein
MSNNEFTTVQLIAFKEHRCPICNYSLIRLSSMNKKICTYCNKEFPWELDENQLPLVKYQR